MTIGSLTANHTCALTTSHQLVTGALTTNRTCALTTSRQLSTFPRTYVSRSVMPSLWCMCGVHWPDLYPWCVRFRM